MLGAKPQIPVAGMAASIPPSVTTARSVRRLSRQRPEATACPASHARALAVVACAAAGRRADLRLVQAWHSSGTHVSSRPYQRTANISLDTASTSSFSRTVRAPPCAVSQRCMPTHSAPRSVRRMHVRFRSQRRSSVAQCWSRRTLHRAAFVAPPVRVGTSTVTAGVAASPLTGFLPVRSHAAVLPRSVPLTHRNDVLRRRRLNSSAVDAAARAPRTCRAAGWASIAGFRYHQNPHQPPLRSTSLVGIPK